MRNPSIVAVALVALVGITWAGPKDEPETPKKKPTVKELMVAAHGKPKTKGPSPLEVVREQVKLDEPDWKLLAENTIPLHRLAEAVKDAEFGYRAPGSSYAKPVSALVAATKKQDVEAARSAVALLGKSCAGCHYGR